MRNDPLEMENDLARSRVLSVRESVHAFNDAAEEPLGFDSNDAAERVHKINGYG